MLCNQVKLILKTNGKNSLESFKQKQTGIAAKLSLLNYLYIKQTKHQVGKFPFKSILAASAVDATRHSCITVSA